MKNLVKTARLTRKNHQMRVVVKRNTKAKAGARAKVLEAGLMKKDVKTRAKDTINHANLQTMTNLNIHQLGTTFDASSFSALLFL